MRIDALKEIVKDCTKCDLCKTRTQVVFGEGSSSPKVLLVGDSPDDVEDAEGKMFLGDGGIKLDRILAYLGTDRSEVYLTNAILCNTPLNRYPRQEELAACRWRLLEQINILKPDLIVALGRAAFEQLRGEKIKGALSNFFPDKIDADWIKYTTDEHKCIMAVTYHPNYHLRSPERAYKVTLSHWKKIKEWLNEYQQ